MKESVSIIGGADGPTSVFVAGKRRKQGLARRLRQWKLKRRMDMVKESLVAKPHSLEEVVCYMKEKYQAEEISRMSREFQMQKKSRKESLILKYRPELLGEAVKRPESQEREEIERFWREIEERSKKAEGVLDEVFPMDFHIFRIVVPGCGEVRVDLELCWDEISSCCSGDGGAEMKNLYEISRDIYRYYGVREEDIREESERFRILVHVLADEEWKRHKVMRRWRKW